MSRQYWWVVAVVAVPTLFALVPLRRPRPAGLMSFIFGYLLNELPFVAFYWLALRTLLALRGNNSPSAVQLGAAAITAGGIAVVAWRATHAGTAVAQALDRNSLAWHRSRLPRGCSLWRILLAPIPLWRRDVQRISNIDYGDAGRYHRLDIYRQRTGSNAAPVLIHFHGGHFEMGAKSREARPLMHRLASHGWLCISANYRLRTAGRHPNALIDAKRVIAWAHEHAAEYGGDPSTVVVAGSSSGAHLAATAALTPNDPAFQADLGDADTSVRAAACFYGYYGVRDTTHEATSTPLAYVTPQAPPFLVAHGTNDTVVPIAAADHFVQTLRNESNNPVVYARLPAAQHSFDLFHSVRNEHVIDAVEEFAANYVLTDPRKP